MKHEATRRKMGSIRRLSARFRDRAVPNDNRCALVTLVSIEGSSPRPLGAQMAVSETGDWVGYLSGGCIERTVVTEALDALALGRNRRVRYGKGSPYIDINLPCGSAIELFSMLICLSTH